MPNISEDNRSTETKRKRAYKITVKRAKITGLLCLTVICIVLLLMSPLFSIKSIVINSGEYLKTETILTSLGFSRGDNIFSIDTSSAKKKVESLDRVGSCTIERTLPGKVTVTISDKFENGYIKTDSGYVGIDENGRCVIVTDSPEGEVPLISGIKIDDAQKGDYIKSKDKNGKQKSEFLIRFMTAVGEHSLAEHIKSINISDLKSVSAVLVTNTVVNFGEDGKDERDRIEYKIAFLKGILQKDYPKSGGIIELSDTDNVTGRMN